MAYDTIWTTLTQIDQSRDGIFDKHIEESFAYKDGVLVWEHEFLSDNLYGFMSSRGKTYEYNELGQVIFNELTYDPWIGGIPDVTHVHFTYNELGLVSHELKQYMEWANPDNVVVHETHKNFQYREDGQPTWMRADYFYHGTQMPSDYREETWTYDDFGRMTSHKIDDPWIFDFDVVRFYTYRSDGKLQNIKLQDEFRFGDERPRVVESFSYKLDGSLKESTEWGVDTSNYGWVSWLQTQYTHTSPGYDKITKLIDTSGDFKPDFKEIIDTWRNADGQETHVLTSYYDGAGALTGRDKIVKTWEGDRLIAEVRDFNIHDGVIEYQSTSSEFVLDLLVA